MSRIKYPTVESIISTNKTVLELNRAKKADKHELLGSRFTLTKIINKAKRKKGDIQDKASILLQGIINSHVFASGNRRTAFGVIESFIIKNTGKRLIKDKEDKKNIEMFRKIRYRQTTDEEVIRWLKD